MSSKAKISIEKQLSYSNGGEQGGVDIREPSTALFGISSIDRYRTLPNAVSYPLNPAPVISPYDFQITAPAQALMSGFFTRLAVNEVQFNWTIPTITSRNNKIYVNYAPANNSVLTSVTVSGAAIFFGMASTTGYSALETIRVGMPPVVVGGVSYQISGVYQIISTTGTAITCINDASLPDFSIVTQIGTIAQRTLVTIDEGWYDLYNNNTSDALTLTGNLAYELERSIQVQVADLPSFLCQYAPNTGSTLKQTIVDTSPSNTNTRTTNNLVTLGQPFNAFWCDSGTSTTFYFEPYVEPTRPNAVGLFQMMGFKNNQTLTTTLRSSPNISLLSTPFVDICCDGLTYNQALKDTDTGLIPRTMLCRLSLTPDGYTGDMANLGANPILVHRTFPFPKQIRWSAMQPIGNLRFQVYDSQGYLLTTFDPANGLHVDDNMGNFSLSLLVSEV